MAGRDERQGSVGLKELPTPLVIMGIFWALAVALWQVRGNLFYLFDFGHIGTPEGVGPGSYKLLPRKKKPYIRSL